jgi:hypothetical protein
MTAACPVEGGCLCGSIRFRLSGPPIQSGYCHCRWCQLNSGAPVVAWVEFPLAAFAYTRGTPGVYHASSWGQREFCSSCGSFLIYRERSAPISISINTAALDDPSLFPPAQHIFRAHRIPWFETADHLPRHDGAGPSRV